MDNFDPETRVKAERLIDFIGGQGLRDAEDWVRSEFEEDIPQVARALLLRTLWRSAIDVHAEGASWIQPCVDEARRHPNGPFANSGEAIRRMVEAEVDPDDIARLARMVAYEAVFSALYAIDLGEAELPGDGSGLPGLPGWTLMETDRDTGAPTGRLLGGLHESLLSLDPSGHEGCPS